MEGNSFRMTPKSGRFRKKLVKMNHFHRFLIYLLKTKLIRGWKTAGFGCSRWSDDTQLTTISWSTNCYRTEPVGKVRVSQLVFSPLAKHKNTDPKQVSTTHHYKCFVLVLLSTLGLVRSSDGKIPWAFGPCGLGAFRPSIIKIISLNRTVWVCPRY